MSLRVAPVGSSQGQGVIEGFHQTFFAQVRTIRIGLTTRLELGQEELQVDHPIFPWIVKRSVWVLNRFLIHDDGLSSFHRRNGKGPLPGLAEFGEKVFFKAHGKHFTAKADPSFTAGFWIGRDPDSGEHLIFSTGGVFKARTIKRMQLQRDSPLTL